MAVYKVIQDIEAEDKLLGPLTLKGFIYAAIAGVLAFLSVRLAMAGSLGDFRWALIILILPPMVLFGILAAPLGKEQPTEVWLLSHVRFFLKPRRRIWDQSGAIQTVTITAPKKVERQLTKNLSNAEVKSRLKALAAILDSRGWALKNADVDSAIPGYFQALSGDSDRLISAADVAQDEPVLDVHAKDDIMDSGSNATAQYFDQMIQKADTNRKQAVMDKINAAREAKAEPQIRSRRTPNPTGWQPPSTVSGPVAEPLGDPELYNKHPHFDTKPSLAEERRQQAQPMNPSEQPARQQAQQAALPAQNHPVTTAYTADKMELAKSGNAFSVASLSKLANRHETVEQVGPGEVVINLH